MSGPLDPQLVSILRTILPYVPSSQEHAELSGNPFINVLSRTKSNYFHNLAGEPKDDPSVSEPIAP